MANIFRPRLVPYFLTVGTLVLWPFSLGAHIKGIAFDTMIDRCEVIAVARFSGNPPQYGRPSAIELDVTYDVMTDEVTVKGLPDPKGFLRSPRVNVGRP